MAEDAKGDEGLASIQAYLSEAKIQERLQAAVNELARNTPDDPFGYLVSSALARFAAPLQSPEQMEWRAAATPARCRTLGFSAESQADVFARFAKPFTISRVSGTCTTPVGLAARWLSLLQLEGREVLDSRGNPTVECDVFALVHGEVKVASCAATPSASCPQPHPSDSQRR